MTRWYLDDALVEGNELHLRLLHDGLEATLDVVIELDFIEADRGLITPLVPVYFATRSIECSVPIALEKADVDWIESLAGVEGQRMDAELA